VAHLPTILCIDDNVLTLAIRKAMLESRNYRVFTANSGAAGLEIVNREAIDVVILDYNMPGMDGGTVAEEIHSKHPDVAILLLSGFPSKLPESVLSIVDGFIYKGSSPAILLQEVQRVTAARRQRPEGIPRTLDGTKRQVEHTQRLIARSRRWSRHCRQQRER
jgi:CheY-like chemotaxis protein